MQCLHNLLTILYLINIQQNVLINFVEVPIPVPKTLQANINHVLKYNTQRTLSNVTLIAYIYGMLI